MVDMAIALGETVDGLYYSALLRKLKPEWHMAFWDPTILAYAFLPIFFRSVDHVNC